LTPLGLPALTDPALGEPRMWRGRRLFLGGYDYRPAGGVYPLGRCAQGPWQRRRTRVYMNFIETICVRPPASPTLKVADWPLR
jgi:hypothetical protein